MQPGAESARHSTLDSAPLNGEAGPKVQAASGQGARDGLGKEVQPRRQTNHSGKDAFLSSKVNFRQFATLPNERGRPRELRLSRRPSR
jgi:hypothetical protein